jgi:hypothetical protein
MRETRDKKIGISKRRGYWLRSFLEDQFVAEEF